ncbi:hypothetical protein ACF0H5_018954 [Mactra antiquata]
MSVIDHFNFDDELMFVGCDYNFTYFAQSGRGARLHVTSNTKFVSLVLYEGIKEKLLLRSYTETELIIPDDTRLVVDILDERNVDIVIPDVQMSDAGIYTVTLDEKITQCWEIFVLDDKSFIIAVSILGAIQFITILVFGVCIVLLYKKSRQENNYLTCIYEKSTKRQGEDEHKYDNRPAQDKSNYKTDDIQVSAQHENNGYLEPDDFTIPS